jgi:ligand-binding sensor protein/GAF domain-containing protein
MPLELSDIVDPSYLQAMLETFSDDMRTIGIQTASAILNKDARPIIFEVNHCDFCKQVREKDAGEHKCLISDQSAINRAEQRFNETGNPEAEFYICDMGLIDFCAPITIEKDIVGYFFGGQLKGGFKYKDTMLMTQKSPDLTGLKRELRPDEMGSDNFNKYIEALNRNYIKMQETEADKLNQLKRAVDAMTQQLNSIVKELAKSKRVEEVEKYMQKAIAVRNVDKLFNLIVNDLPPIMGAEYCSIFTVQQGETEDADCLVLRKTSYPKLEPKEDSAYYMRGEKALTVWVWENAKPLRLKDVKNTAELSRHNATWSQGKYNDSDKHKGFLAVPIIGHKNQVIGVIRIPHKKWQIGVGDEHEVSFTNYDEVFLNFLAHHLSRVIECQELEEQFERAEGLVMAAIELARATSGKEINKLAAKYAMSLFGGGVGKEYFVNCHSPESETWKVKRVEGGLVLSGKWKNRKFNVNQGLTGRVIREKRPLLLYDLKKAKDEGYYIEAVPDGKSVMAAPLKYGEKVYGIIGVVSNKEFSFSEKDEKILTILAEITADAIVSARWFGVRRFAKRVLDFFVKRIWDYFF